MAKRAEKKAPKQSERLNYGEVSRELKTGGPQRLYLLYGQEDYLREAFLGELKALCLPDGGDDFSYHRLDGRTLDMRELEEAVNALPFLSERALTEVRGYDLGRCRDQEAEALERIVSDIPEYCTLVFVQDSGYEPDQRQKAVKSLKKYGKVINFTSQGQAPLVKWISKRFAALGKAVTPDACLALIYSSGELMSGLIPEIEKLGAGVRGDTVTVAGQELKMSRPKKKDFLLRLADKFLGKTGLFGSHIDDSFVIKGNMQLLCYPLRYDAAAGAKLPANGYNSVCHGKTSYLFLLIFKYSTQWREKPRAGFTGSRIFSLPGFGAVGEKRPRYRVRRSTSSSSRGPRRELPRSKAALDCKARA